MADRQQATISQTGVWVDTRTGQVVESEPEEGRLLVAPGGEIDQRIQDDIDAAKAQAGQADPPAEPEAEQEAEKPKRGRGAQKATSADTTEKATE